MVTLTLLTKEVPITEGSKKAVGVPPKALVELVTAAVAGTALAGLWLGVG